MSTMPSTPSSLPAGSANSGANNTPGGWAPDELQLALAAKFSEPWCRQLLDKVFVALRPALVANGFEPGLVMWDAALLPVSPNYVRVPHAIWMTVKDPMGARPGAELKAWTALNCACRLGAADRSTGARSVRLTVSVAVRLGYVQPSGQFLDTEHANGHTWAMSLVDEGADLMVVDVAEVGRWVEQKVAKSLDPDVFAGPAGRLRIQALFAMTSTPDVSASAPAPTLAETLAELVAQMQEDLAP